MWKTILFIIIMTNCVVLMADDRTWQTGRVEDWIEAVGLDDWLEEADESQQAELFEELNTLHLNPIDLNHATWEDLGQIPFLTPRQQDQLATYLYEHVPLSTLQELLLVDGWGTELYWRVVPFVCIDSVKVEVRKEMTRQDKWNEWLTKGHSTLRLKASLTLQHKEGYNRNDSLIAISKAYLGSPVYASGRYLYRYGKNLQWGISAERDAGEKLIDFVTGHAYLKDVGIMRQLVVGDYKVSVGQGLILSSGMFGGKTMACSRQQASDNMFKPHTSTSESGFQRGIGLELSLRDRRWRAAAFVSYRLIDTNRSGDSFSSIKDDGLHRTVSDTIKKQNTKQLMTGGRLRYAGQKLHVSVNGLYFSFDGEWQPEIKPYNIFYFRGSKGWNASVDGRCLLGNWILSGEWAIGTGGGMAGIIQGGGHLHQKVDCFLSGRVYSPSYKAPFASAFGVNGSTTNETGIYSQLNCRLIPFVELMMYFDYYCFPWLKYRVNSPSEGVDMAVEAKWTPTATFQCVLRYRMKQGQENAETGSVVGIVPLCTYTRRQIKSQILYTLQDVRLKTAFYANQFVKTEKTWGFAISQDVRFAKESFPLSVAGQVALFDTDTYDNRVYISGPDLAGTMPFSSFYGRGGRYTLLATWNVSAKIKWDVVLKHTLYADRTSIGSGLEAIDGNCQTYFGTTLRVKL